MLIFKRILNSSRPNLKCRLYYVKNYFKHRYCTKIEENLSEIPVERIRNFSIIAHVDHGKSTLADRLLEITGVKNRNDGVSQALDKLQVERERGITVKAQSASLVYKYKGQDYLLNLIDTPGHVDFSNEVSRSLSACQGVVLVIDANDGVQAQTVANFYLAFGQDLFIVPVINKIDLKNANPEKVCGQLKSLFDIEPEEVIKISAKLGTNVHQVLDAIIDRLPPPPVNRNDNFRALLFDSWYDRYRGALNLIYIHDGIVQIGDQITSCHSKKSYEVKSLAVLRPQEVNVKKLVAGQVGLVGCNMRSSKEAHIGDTLCLTDKPVIPLQGFIQAKPMVFAGVYPMDQSQHVALRGAIEKLVLNDAAVSVSIDSSPALGHGWRLGFLGLLHLEVFCQRLQQEFAADPILTAPSVTYKVKLKSGKPTNQHGTGEVYITNPALLPDPLIVDEYYEPMVIGTIITPTEYLGPVISLCIDRRGIQRISTNIDNDRVMLQYDLPLCEIVLDFHDALKSITSGYASFDYEDNGFHPSNIVKLSILLNGVVVDELCNVVHISRAQTAGRQMCLRLKEMIPRQLIQIAIQAAIGSRVVARETLKPFRKDVTSKLYGGDVTRRMKLLARQSEGKRKMKSVANISIPRETFIDVLKR